MGRRAGRRRGREGRSRAARPAGGGGDQAVRAGRGGAVRPRRVAEGRPPPRHRSTATRRTSPGPCTSRPRSTSPTPSTSTGPSPRVPRRARRSGPPCRSAPGGRWRWVTWPAPRPPSTSPQPAAPMRHGHLPAAREVVLHAHFAATTDGQVTVFGPTGRLEEGQRLVLLDQVKAWCADRGPGSPSSPSSTSPPSTSARASVPDRLREQMVLRDGTCVFPWCSRPGTLVRCGPRRPLRPSTPPPRADPSPVPRPPRTSRRCVGTTTGSRPTPPGATPWSERASSSGPAPTATASTATPPAAPRSSRPSPGPKMTPPRTPPLHRWRGHRHVRGREPDVPDSTGTVKARPTPGARAFPGWSDREHRGMKARLGRDLSCNRLHERGVLPDVRPALGPDHS